MVAVVETMTRGSPLTLPPYSPQTIQFFARLATQPTPARAALYDRLITTLVNAGIWQVLDLFYVLAAFDQPTALTNLIQGKYNGTNINSVTFVQDRYMENIDGAARTIDTGFDPHVAVSPHYIQDNATLFGWLITTGSLFNSATVCDNNTGGGASLTYVGSGGLTSLKGRVNSGTVTYAATVTTTATLLALTRTASNVVNGYAAGVLQTATAGGTTVSNGLPNNILDAVGGSTNEGFDDPQTAAVGLGGALTTPQHATLYNALRTYLLAVGAI